MYRMNENTVISVETPVGKTKEESSGPTIGQGTVDGCIISSVGIDQGVKEYFHSEEDEKDGEKEKEKRVANENDVDYGEHPIKPLI